MSVQQYHYRHSSVACVVRVRCCPTGSWGGAAACSTVNNVVGIFYNVGHMVPNLVPGTMQYTALQCTETETVYRYLVVLVHLDGIISRNNMPGGRGAERSQQPVMYLVLVCDVCSKSFTRYSILPLPKAVTAVLLVLPVYPVYVAVHQYPRGHQYAIYAQITGYAQHLKEHRLRYAQITQQYAMPELLFWCCCTPLEVIPGILHTITG